MKYVSIKEAVKGILSKSMDADEAFVRVAPEHREEFSTTLAYILEKASCGAGAASEIVKAEALSKPPVSEAQRKAMWAAAKGHSNVGIPASVGKDFAESDPGGKLPAKKKTVAKDDPMTAGVTAAASQGQVSTTQAPPNLSPSGAAGMAAAFGKDDPLTSGVTRGTSGGTISPPGTTPSLDPAGVSGMKGAFKTEVLKFEKNGQWKFEDASDKKDLHKAIKPGPTLDYSKFNKKPDYAENEAKAPTINYSNSPGIKPSWSGATDKARAVRNKLDAEAKETAEETIARRQGKKPMLKNEGTNLDAPVADKGRMTAKNEMLGYGPTGSPANAMHMSEAEPHKDDPHHEAKEKVKAKKIKDEAEDLLDMHKADDESRSVFSMDHSHQVAGMPHEEGKAHLHAIVDASSANPGNKAKIKAAINGTKNSRQLSGLVANHVLAAGGGGHKTGSLKVIR